MGIVYSVLNEGTVMTELLEKAGYTVVIGDGTLDMKYVGECCALVPGRCRITSDILDAAPLLKIIAKPAVGLDNVDIPACTAHGVYVANAALANYISVAELVLADMLNAAHRLPNILAQYHGKNADWKEARTNVGTELYGKTLAVIGLGNIGKRVAALAEAFGMQINGYDPYADPSRIPDTIKLFDTIPQAVADADFVTIHVAGGESVRGLIGKEVLDAMKPTAVLINTTRGFVVDEEALIAALQEHRIGGAALDVYTEEPPRKDDPLLSLPNVITTPHIGGLTAESRYRAQVECAQNIINVLNGKMPRGVVNKNIR